MTVEQLPEAVNKTLDVLAARFGARGADLWHMMAVYYRWSALIWMIGGAAVFAGLAVAAYRWQPDHYREFFFKYSGIFVGAFVALCFIACNLADVIMPQAGVLFWILGQAGK